MNVANYSFGKLMRANKITDGMHHGIISSQRIRVTTIQGKIPQDFLRANNSKILLVLTAVHCYLDSTLVPYLLMEQLI